MTEQADDVVVGATDQARLAQAVMQRQLGLSLRVGAIFFVLIFGLPLFNWLAPGIANARIGGFTLTWLILGVLFYPLTWLLSGYFIRESDRLETEITDERHKLERSVEPR